MAQNGFWPDLPFWPFWAKRLKSPFSYMPRHREIGPLRLVYSNFLDIWPRTGSGPPCDRPNPRWGRIKLAQVRTWRL